MYSDVKKWLQDFMALHGYKSVSSKVMDSRDITTPQWHNHFRVSGGSTMGNIARPERITRDIKIQVYYHTGEIKDDAEAEMNDKADEIIYLLAESYNYHRDERRMAVLEISGELMEETIGDYDYYILVITLSVILTRDGK